MSEYPRVTALRPSERQTYAEYACGPLKVVPADAIVIERGELPEVTESGHFLWAPGAGGSVSVKTSWSERQARAEALAYLSIAEHLAAHPPVDEAQVNALGIELDRLDLSGDVGPLILARRLVERGVRIEVKR